MRALGTLALEIQRSEDHEPSRVSVVLANATPDADGVLRLTPQCMTLDELEGAINALQDELDVLRADARRAFTMSGGLSEISCAGPVYHHAVTNLPSNIMAN